MREGRDSGDRGSSRRDDNDDRLPIRNNATASKFQWTNLLKESGNFMTDGEERGIRGDYGRNHDVLMGSLSPVRGEMINNSHSFGNAGCRGNSRNVAIGGSIEDHNCGGRVRNVSGLRGEDVVYCSRVRNMTGNRIENADYNRTVNGRSRFVMVELPVEGAAYPRCSRTMMDVHPGEDADYQGPTRRVAGRLVEDGEYSRHLDRRIPMKSYEEDDYYRYRNEDSSRSLTPRSQSNGQLTSIRPSSFTNSDVPQREVLRHPADRLRIGGSISPSDYYNSHGILYPKAGTNARVVSNDGGTYPRADYNPNLTRRVEYPFPENHRSEDVCRMKLSEDICDRYENVQDYHDHGEFGDLFGNDTLDSALPRHRSVGNSHNWTRHDYGYTVQEEPIDDLSRTGHRRLVYGASNIHPMDLDCENGIEDNDGVRLHNEQVRYRNDVSGVLHEDSTWIYPTLEEDTLFLHEEAQQRLQSGDIDSHDLFKRMPKRKRNSIGNTSLLKRRTSTLGGRGALSYEQSRHFDSKVNAGMSITESRLPFGGLSKGLQSRLSKPHESGSTDVKSRLNVRFAPSLYGPKASKHHLEKMKSCAKSSLILKHETSAPQVNGKAQRTSVKKRLKVASHMDAGLPDPQVSHSGLNLESQQKLVSKNSSTTTEVGALLEADPDHSILKVKATEKDPPDNSEELRRQVDHWFSKCMLYINASPGRLKKFKDQGTAGSMKCIICSSSKEFIQTKDVATHAFTSLKVGLRAGHLGFHRALCVLMGWDPDVSSNGRWICKSLPDIEARALKEDLILWPPVVVIHNGSVGDFYNNELVKISVKQLENTLRDMGLSEGKATICHGKPGNPNIMLVKFNGTLSGLQEAERLDKVFSEKKRGRANLQEVITGLGCNGRVVQEEDDKIEHSLCGLHEAERLDKVYSEKKCLRANLQEVDAGVGCSKKVVQAIDNKIDDTLHGLQEIENFDKVFSEKIHGREEVDTGDGCCVRVVQEADNKLEDSLSGLHKSERLDKDLYENQHGQANFQGVDTGVGCGERVVQDNKIESTLSSLQNVGLDMEFSEKKCEKANLHEVATGIGCSKRVIRETDTKKEDTLSDLQAAERLDKVSEKECGRENLREVDAGVGCSKSVFPEAGNMIADSLFSLQDAKSVDKVLSEKECGRTNFQEADAGVGCSERVLQEAGNKIEDTLYGYLGVVEDLDKLNYELKRRVVGKSKKEILACIDTAT